VLEADFVARQGWLTHGQFLEGLALGQVTPGPVLVTATFLGYQVSGLMGALAATIGIYIPAFVNGLWLIPRLWGHLEGRRTAGAQAFLSWAVPVVIGGVLGASLRMGAQSLGFGSWGSGVLWLLLGLGVLASARWRWPAWVVIPGTGFWVWMLFWSGVNFGG